MSNIMLYFNFENKVYEYHLPAINNRRMTVNLHELGMKMNCELDFEVWDNVWFVKSTKDVSLSRQGQSYNLYELKVGNILNGSIVKTQEIFSVLVIEQNHQVTSYEKYYIKNLKHIRIGKDEHAEVVIENEYISKNHAELYQNGQGFYIQDSSRNGTFVNNERLLTARKLEIFDEIYIVGIKFVFLGDILAINHAEEVTCRLVPIMLTDIQGILEQEEHAEPEDDGYFSRAPRTMKPLATEAVEIEGPPSAQREKKQPLIFIIGPSVTMPIPIMMSVLFNMNMNANGSSNPMMYLGTLISVLSSALIGAGWAIAHSRYSSKQNREDEAHRIESYKRYIQNNEELLKGKHAYNKSVLEKQYLSTAELCRLYESSRTLLWNRNVNHEDFLTIRLGKGSVPFPAQITIPKERFSMQEDELGNLPYELLKKYRNMPNAVSRLNLKENKLIGVIGGHERILSVMKTMVIQTAALHCYTEVKMAFLTNKSDAKKMDWLRWLPHFFSQDKKLRYIANDDATYQNVLYALSEELRSRQEQLKEENDKTRFRTHYIVFCTEAELLEKEALYSYMVSTQNYGFTFVLLYDKMDRLPNECVRILQYDAEYQGNYLLTEMKNEVNELHFDEVSDREADRFARNLSGIYVNEAAGGEIPSSIDFMEMMQIPKLEDWDLIKRYKENRVYEGIRAMIGATYGNKPMYLDIHEKKSGPHGLVAGTTGSGKSETLMTFILSLAMNYHPDEVAFVLIDYKGGGMAAPFIGMPHLAGTITNIGNNDETESIDENQTRRALISIRSEIRRRQKLFNQYKVNHIDAYIRLYRDGAATEPLPHLIIISDEFAELKKEQPAFIKELVSTARVGRSLGVHLILATQKPAGVVDDEIWSNSRFKLCLRVQDKQDSIGMLKRPEAAYITGIGRAYMQIGNDEIFEMFQSGYAGAMYEPKETVELSQHNEVSMIGLDGSKLVAPVRKVSSSTVSQLDACVEYITKTAAEHHIKGVRPLWMPQLPDKLKLSDIEEFYGKDKADNYTIYYGLVDEPDTQKQYPAQFSWLEEGNVLIVGGIGMGKTTLLQTILYESMVQMSAEECNMYIFDFSSRILNMFEKSPHCGGVVWAEEEEKITRVLQMLTAILEERKELFQTLGVGNYRECIQLQKLPLVIFAIDNFNIIKEQYNGLIDEITYLVREGVRYGIHAVFTVNNMNEITPKLRQVFTRHIPIGLAERGAYMDVLGKNPEFIPKMKAGRGLLIGDYTTELQIALAGDGDSEMKRNESIRRAAEARAEQSTVQARKIRVLPKNESYVEFCEQYEKQGELPIGYDYKTVNPISLLMKQCYCVAVSSEQIRSRTLLYENLYYALAGQQAKICYVAKKCPTGVSKEEYYNYSYESLYRLAVYLKKEFTERNRRLGADDEVTFEQQIAVFIEDMPEFLERVYDRGNEESMNPLFELFFKKGSEHGIIFFAYIPVADYNAVNATAAGALFLKGSRNIYLGGYTGRQRLLDIPESMKMQNMSQEENVVHMYVDNVYQRVFMPNQEGDEQNG